MSHLATGDLLCLLYFVLNNIYINNKSMKGRFNLLAGMDVSSDNWALLFFSL